MFLAEKNKFDSYKADTRTVQFFSKDLQYPHKTLQHSNVEKTWEPDGHNLSWLKTFVFESNGQEAINVKMENAFKNP